jgi:hypothetical protein
MGITKQNKYVIFLSIISLILFIFVYKLINYLVVNDFIVECFSSNIIPESMNTSHTVNLPLTTTYTCKNFCGPTARCAITGQQCFTDIDCPGCQPYVPPLSSSSRCIPGDNDAGKLTMSQTPQYSTLTTDIGTRAKLITSNKFSQPAMANFGLNTWRTAYDESDKLFNKRYKPNQLQYMPNYDKRYSLTGEFIDDGPLPSNAYLK